MKTTELKKLLQELPEGLKSIDEKFQIDEDSFIVIYSTKDNQNYYAIIIDGKIWEQDSTGHKLPSDLLKDIICMGEVWG